MSRSGKQQDGKNHDLVIAPSGAMDRTKQAAFGAVVGAIAVVPVVGPVLGGIVGAFIPNAKLDRATRFLEDLAEELRQCKDHVDGEFIHRDEFAAAVEDVLDRVTRRRTTTRFASSPPLWPTQRPRIVRPQASEIASSTCLTSFASLIWLSLRASPGASTGCQPSLPTQSARPLTGR